MPKFNFLIYEPADPTSFGIEAQIETKQKLTRNSEKDFVLTDAFNESYDKLKQIYLDAYKDNGLDIDPKFLAVALDFISSTTKWEDCSYYAHEVYEWVEGRYRTVRMRSGRKFYEVQCLDPDLYVCDGYWDYTEVGRINNGNGDYIE